MSTPMLLRLLLAASLLASSTAHAQLFRAYLASTGNDANPCTVQAPCRLLPAALATVKDGGEVWIMDSANFNTAPVNITKSVSILAIPGVLGSIVGSGGNAINIATPGVKVALRNLKILNFDAGQHGISMTNGASLKVDGCEIAGFSGESMAGIRVATPAKVSIVDTMLRDNFQGIWFDNGAKGDVVRTTAVGNVWVGIYAYVTVESTVSVTVSDSVSSNNAWGFAVYSDSAARTGSMTVSRSTASHNSHDGFSTLGGFAQMVVSGSVSSRNAGGLTNYGGSFFSLGDNTVLNNTTDSFGVISIAPPK